MLAKKVLNTISTSKATLHPQDAIPESKMEGAGNFYRKPAKRKSRITIACIQSLLRAFLGGWGRRVIWRARKLETTRRTQQSDQEELERETARSRGHSFETSSFYAYSCLFYSSAFHSRFPALHSMQSRQSRGKIMTLYSEMFLLKHLTSRLNHQEGKRGRARFPHSLKNISS
jgi:hypothetical protein